MLAQQGRALARSPSVCCVPLRRSRRAAAVSARLGAVPAPRRPGAGAPLPRAPHQPAAAHAPGEPFQPERTFHKGRARQGGKVWQPRCAG